ncbi:MAG: polysaccharide biosynthesis protein [Oscillospiraceae bacterium]|nr:polysaccharide biosynthesis protein [Oscillospiraceae bacterium]
MRRKSLLRILLIVTLDVILMVAAGGIALFVRYDFSFNSIPEAAAATWHAFLPFQICGTLVVYLLRRMYHYIWRSVCLQDVVNMLLSVLLGFALSYAMAWVTHNTMTYGLSFITLVCQMAAHIGMRCVLRVYTTFRHASGVPGEKMERIMLIGAGEAGRILLREIQSSAKITAKVCCLIDDNADKWGKYLEGVRIYGGRERIPGMVDREKITQIILAIPTASAKDRADILDICKHTGCRIRILPGIYQMVNGDVSMAAVKDVQVEDLLNRDPIRLDVVKIRQFLEDRTVLVTGGGGSIGSELCRQIAACRPKKLIILDIYENTTYDLQQQLKRTYGDDLDINVEIASVREKDKVFGLFERYHPDIVFHAAAHKHVPLMEDCPEEAIKNNIFGTYHVVLAAEAYGVKKFVMISTDKAVNPTNVMGATKRFGEMILQSRANSKTEFVSVRFGNVLGSNGSVVPLFKRQIEEGGPVTITDKRIIRYFMTISEAVQLVLEAGAIAESNQTFVLDMGEPVKILDMAENLIRLSGFVPYRDIEIKEVGLRPGEKLYEELLINNIDLKTTENEKIFIDQHQPIDQNDMERYLERLRVAVEGDPVKEDVIALMKELVPTYRAPQEHNAAAMSR